ncbi:DsbA family protein [Nocardia sp. NBC_01377]|uniref:DsbA family protein n=1 Tax=Nocardia sp. NBC_01377 TaxID=2903595 RepID=UPI00324E3578
MNRRPTNPLATADKTEKRRRTLIQIAVAAVLVGLIAAIGANIAVKRADRDRPSATPSIPAVSGPTGVTGSLTDQGAIRIGKPGAPRTIRLVADLQCPACKEFEHTYGPLLEDAVTNGRATVDYDIIAFLDRASTSEYSSRAANASYCAAESDPTKYQRWLATMYDHQPREGSDGLPDTTLVTIAAGADYTDPAFGSCVTDHRYIDYARARTQEVLTGGVQSTPTIFLDGTQVSATELAAALSTDPR